MIAPPNTKPVGFLDYDTTTETPPLTPSVVNGTFSTPSKEGERKFYQALNTR
jgi:hypothetical protein